MRSISKDHVQQNHSHLGIAGFLEHALIAQSVIDHGMGTPTGEEIVAQINDRMPPTGPDVAQAVFWIHRSV